MKSGQRTEMVLDFKSNEKYFSKNMLSALRRATRRLEGKPHKRLGKIHTHGNIDPVRNAPFKIINAVAQSNLHKHSLSRQYWHEVFDLKTNKVIKKIALTVYEAKKKIYELEKFGLGLKRLGF